MFGLGFAVLGSSQFGRWGLEGVSLGSSSSLASQCSGVVGLTAGALDIVMSLLWKKSGNFIGLMAKTTSDVLEYLEFGNSQMEEGQRCLI